MTNRTVNLLLTVLVVMSSVIAFFSIMLAGGVVYNGHMRALYGDEWTNITFLFDRGLSDSILYRHHAHPIILPNAVFRIDYLLLDASGKARSIFTACSSFLVALGIARLSLVGYGSLRVEERKMAISIALAILAMGMWMGMGVKLIWIFGITDHFVAIGSLIAAFGLIRMHSTHTNAPAIGFVILVFGSLFASFSFGTGLTVWVAFSIILWVSGIQSRYTIAYIAIGITTVYLAMFVIPSFGNTTPPISVPDLGLIVDWFRVVITVIGNVWVNVLKQTRLVRFGDASFLVAQGIGLSAIVVLAWLVFKRKHVLLKDPPALGLIAIALLALGGAGLVALSRLSTWGLEVGLTPRYAAISLLFWMPVFGLVSRVIALNNKQRTQTAELHLSKLWIATSACLVIIFIAYTNYKYVPSFMRVSMNTTIGGLSVMVDPNKNNTNIKKYYAHVDTAIRVTEKIRQYDKDIFKENLDEYLDQSTTNVLENLGALIMCRGKFEHVPYYDQANSILLRGWTSSNDKISLKHILIANNGLIIGVGSTAPILNSKWRSERIDPEDKLTYQINQTYPELALALGVPDGGWVAIARTSPETLMKLKVFAVFDDGNYCQINL